MNPEQIDQALSRLESVPREMLEELKAVAQDESLSPSGRDERRRQLRAQTGEEISELENEISEAVQRRLQQLEVEIGDERRRFFDLGPIGTGAQGAQEETPASKTLARLDSFLRRADLRQRWNLTSGREMMSHYQELLALDDRALVELYEFEAPRLLNSRGDADGETTLRATISQARDMRITDRQQALLKARERAEIFQIRLQNALAQSNDILRGA